MAGVAVLLALVAAFWAGGRLLPAASPADDSAEAGFSRDMQTHHNQAVEMALIIREKSSEPTLRAVAYDIITGQQQQSGQLFGWLTQWGLPQTGSQPAMAWIPQDATGAGHDMTGMSGMSGMSPIPQAPGTPNTTSTSSSAAGTSAGGTSSAAEPGSPALGLLPDGRMPGMASDADIASLRKATGREAEIRFLQLMITHHQAGTAMARAVLPLTDRPEVTSLAESIITAQTAEIEQMKTLLTQHRAAG